MSSILLFAEDPGAALFMRGLPHALRDAGTEVYVLALLHAAPYFAGERLLSMPPTLERSAAQALLQKLRPSAVVVGTAENPETFAFALVDAAREMGIPSFGAVDSAPNAEHRFRGHSRDPLEHVPDRLLVPDDATDAAYRALGLPGNRIAICGHPRMDEIAAIKSGWDDAERRRQRARLFPNAPAGNKIVVFVSELSVGLGDNPFRRTSDYRLSGTSGSDKRSEIVAEELVHAAKALPQPVHLVLRLHPKQRLEDESHAVSLFDQVSQHEPGLEVINAADLVVGMTSILLVEAAALGRPVLSIVPMPEEREWLGDIGRPIPCVWSREAVEDYLGRPSWPEVEAPEAPSGTSGRMAAHILAIGGGEP